uniref:class I SAM-dependent methyltransferase n=1 Tax=uncultured Microbacterium sp. TaxID=191216 RepID=UPI002618524B
KDDVADLGRLEEIASLLGRSATKDDVADLGRLEEIASLLGRSATKDDVAGLERIEGVANTLHDASRTQSDALERVKEGVENADLGKLRPSITSLEWQIRRQRADIISDSQAMHQLLLRFTPEAPLPPVAGWAMSPAGLLMLTDTITKRDAGLVVECGSGSSTLWMALAMKAKARGKVVALEHLDEYAEKTRELLEAHGVADWAEVRVAPLTSVHTAHGDFQWYDTDGMTWENPIDILLVDGPPTTTGEHARYPALSVLGSLLDPSAIIVVDDADRQDEREVMTMWEREWPDLIHRTSPGQGIEVLTRASAR